MAPTSFPVLFEDGSVSHGDCCAVGHPLNGTAFPEPSLGRPLPRGTNLSPLACPIPLENACCCCARVPFPAPPRQVQLYFLALRFLGGGEERKGCCSVPVLLENTSHSLINSVRAAWGPPGRLQQSF